MLITRPFLGRIVDRYGFDGGITIGFILYGYLASLFGYSNMYLLTVIPTFLALIAYALIRKRKD